MDKDFRWAAVAVAGVGPLGKPSLVGPIVVKNDHQLTLFDGDDEELTMMSQWKLDVAVTPPTNLELRGKPDGWRPELAATYTGRHELTFP
jgi:hypothetical protein